MPLVGKVFMARSWKYSSPEELYVHFAQFLNYLLTCHHSSVSTSGAWPTDGMHPTLPTKNSLIKSKSEMVSLKCALSPSPARPSSKSASKSSTKRTWLNVRMMCHGTILWRVTFSRRRLHGICLLAGGRAQAGSSSRIMHCGGWRRLVLSPVVRGMFVRLWRLREMRLFGVDERSSSLQCTSS